jgi:hypothetical protein
MRLDVGSVVLEVSVHIHVTGLRKHRDEEYRHHE